MAEHMTFSSNGIFKGNIEVINSGDFVSLSKGNKGTSAQGQGVVTTKDGSEKANYTFLQVGKTTTKDGKPVLRGVGSVVWSTESAGKLAFLDNILSFFIIEVDERGNFSSKDRESNNVSTSNPKFFSEGVPLACEAARRPLSLAIRVLFLSDSNLWISFQ